MTKFAKKRRKIFNAGWLHSLCAIWEVHIKKLDSSGTVALLVLGQFSDICGP
jgi:hypothetical protein